jgi:hypothetical protein
MLTASAAVALTVTAFAPSSADAAIAYAINDENSLLRFDTASPTLLTGVGNIQLPNGDPIQDLIGIDFRPSTGVLYGVGRGRTVYTINPNNAIATPLGPLLPDPADVTAPIPQNPLLLPGTRFGFDFNPVPDNNPASPPSLRIISDTGFNFRADVDNGLTQQDLNLAPGATIVGASYTNSNAGPTTELDLNGATTTLYGIDSVTSRLVRFTNPNNGTFVTTNIDGVPYVNLGSVSSVMGFDIWFDGQNNQAFAALQDEVGGVNRLYSIDLGTGQATPLGVIGGGDLIDGLTIVPEPAGLGLMVLAGAGLLARRPRA